MSVAELDHDLPVRVAERLAGAPVVDLTRVGGGRNSRVFRLETPKGLFALKQYPSRDDDPRDRLGIEGSALSWMERHGLDVVPRLIASDREQNFSLLSWADGSLVREVGADDIDQAVDFLDRLHRLRLTASFPRSHLATEACLSGAEIERQIEARVAHLRALKDEPALLGFLDGEFAPAFRQSVAAARDMMRGVGLDFAADLPEDRRSLVPSDFGFHNALRAGDGRLTFIDFEYFGWDDPVKLTADVMLHPGTPVASELTARFRAGAERLYGADDASFGPRLAAYLPLFGLRWVLILLNEFHPERWRRRVLAGASYDWTEAKERQLRFARELLSRLSA